MKTLKEISQNKKVLGLLAAAVILSMMTTKKAQAQAQAPATGTLTLPSAIAEAEDNNPELKRLKAVAERISWTKLDAMSGHLPHLSANYDHFMEAKYMRETVILNGSPIDFPAGFPQDNLTLDVSWTLFDGFQSYNKYKAAELNSQAADLDVSRARFKLDRELRSLYYQALAAQKLAEVAAQNVKTLESHLSTVRLTERSGYGTRFDVLRIQASLEEARAEQDAAQNNVVVARSALSEGMGYEVADERPLQGTLPVLQENDIGHELTLALEKRDDLQADMRREEASSKMSFAAKGTWSPTVSLFAEDQFYKFGTFDPDIGSNGTYQNDYSFGIRLHWDIFDGGSSIAKQKIASAQYQEAQAELHKTLAHVPKEIETWKRTFTYNAALYRARMRALDESQESVRLATAGVKAGSRTHTEALDAELDLFRARGGVIRAQADAINALGNLELAVGHPLWTQNP